MVGTTPDSEERHTTGNHFICLNNPQHYHKDKQDKDDGDRDGEGNGDNNEEKTVANRQAGWLTVRRSSASEH